MVKKEINPDGFDPTPLNTRPEKVAIVALGASSYDFIKEQMSNPGMKSPFDEVWTLNRGIRGFPHDKLFVMDDVKWIEKNNKPYADYIKNHDKPVITSTRYDDYPNTLEYPFEKVGAVIQDDVFAVNTVSYMVAYAIYLKVREVSIYGADFIYPNGNMAEKGGQAVAYLCGMMRHFGMTHRIPGSSTLLYANTVKARPDGSQSRDRYGYHRVAEMEKAAAREKALKKARKEI